MPSRESLSCSSSTVNVVYRGGEHLLLGFLNGWVCVAMVVFT